MKIIYLNCFSGQIREKLLRFLAKEKDSTDIFCFQEVSVSLQKEFENLLNDFKSVFEEGFLLSDCNEIAGQSVFYNKKFKFIHSEKILLHELKSNDIGFYLKVIYEFLGKQILIGNVHGTAQPGSKTDTEVRLNQSNLIINASKDDVDYKILGGDLNLLRTTKSIQLFDKNGYKNLINDFNIKATRNNVAWERFKNDPNFVKQYDSDYIFTKGVTAKELNVPNVEISDHEPLILEFEI